MNHFGLVKGMANYQSGDNSLFLSLRFASSINTECPQIPFCYGVSGKVSLQQYTEKSYRYRP